MSGQASDSDIPVPIEDTETIVRAIVAPSHFDKKGRVKAGAFRPKAGSSISVIRQLMGDNFCKAKGVDVGRTAPDGYKGLLVLTAASIRKTGSTVSDSRDEYLGHADLDHGFVSEPNEPATRDAFERMTERCQALRDASTYHADPDPAGLGWRGAPLRLGAN